MFGKKMRREEVFIFTLLSFSCR